MTATNIYGRQVVVPLTNKSGGGVIAGDVVVIDTTNNDAFTTSTAGAFTGLLGVAQETIASNATGRVLTAGYAALVNVNASVTRGNFGKSHTVAKQATDAGASRIAGTFCQFLTGGTTPDAHLFGIADNTSGAGTGTLTTVEEVDGSPTDSAVTKLVLPNGTLAIASHVATLDIGNLLPWHVKVLPMMETADATAQGTWALSTQSNTGINYFLYSPGNTANSGAASCWANGTGTAQNDATAWDVVLGAGTWDAHFYVGRSAASGIITLEMDGVSQGTTDTYSASSDAAKRSITGFTVSTTGKKRMNVKMATKNPSSSNYLLLLFGIEFRRTA